MKELFTLLLLLIGNFGFFSSNLYAQSSINEYVWTFEGKLWEVDNSEIHNCICDSSDTHCNFSKALYGVHYDRNDFISFVVTGEVPNHFQFRMIEPLHGDSEISILFWNRFPLTIWRNISKVTQITFEYPMYEEYSYVTGEKYATKKVSFEFNSIRSSRIEKISISKFEELLKELLESSPRTTGVTID